MSIPLVINGATFNYPVDFDENWGVNATGWAQAVTNGMLQRAGGSFPLLSEVDFGASFGLKALYLKSREASPASTGIIRLANASAGIVWRNGLGSGDLVLTTDSSNNLLFNGTPIGSANTLTDSHIFVGNASNVPTDVAMSGDVHVSNAGATTIQPGAVTNSKIATGTIVDTNMTPGTLTDASISAIAAIVFSKLVALNPFVVPTTDSSGFITNSSTTTTELGYVHGVTSNIQTQINSITGAGQFTSGMGMPFFGSAIPAGWLLCDGSAVSRSTYSSLFGVIGTTYGPGDGSTTFNLPQSVNFTMVGQGGSIAPSLGSSSGATSVTVVQNAHDHTISHAHTMPIADVGTGVRIATNASWAQGTVSLSKSFFGVPAATAGPSTDSYMNTTDSLTANSGSSTATNQASSVVQPSLGINWIIKT